jgi:hypothetical protein
LVFVAHLQQEALEYYFSYSKILVRRVTKGRELGRKYLCEDYWRR